MKAGPEEDREPLLPGQDWLSRHLRGCPCGYHGEAGRECRCTPATIQRYLAEISGPLLDRIDLHITAPAVASQEMLTSEGGVSSAGSRARVECARALQQARGYNARIPARPPALPVAWSVPGQRLSRPRRSFEA